MIRPTVRDIQRLVFVPVGSGRWRSDTPSQPGWYNASLGYDPCVLRWWDGQQWSLPAWRDSTAAAVAAAASMPETEQQCIKWRHLRKELRR